MQFSKIGLVLARKWKRMNQMSTPPFWGVFREVFGVRSKIWALEVPFFGTPQNGGVDIWFIRFHFWASTKPIFENCIFQLLRGLFSHYHGPQTSSGLPSGIYGSINLKLVFWALLTTLKLPCEAGKKIPFFFFGPAYWTAFAFLPMFIFLRKVIPTESST